MANERRQQQQRQLQLQKYQQPQSYMVSHLSNDIYNNGLKFERDRGFRNKLIIKTILIMALLLIVVAVLCATMAKSSSTTTVFNQTTNIIKLLKTGMII